MSEIKFEKALEKLEKIVEELETGQLSLDESLKRYEEGVNLSRICAKKLEEAQRKIEILTKKADGSLEKKPFEPDSLTTDVSEGEEEGTDRSAGPESNSSVSQTKTTKSNKKSQNKLDILTSEDELPF